MQSIKFPNNYIYLNFIQKGVILKSRKIISEFLYIEKKKNIIYQYKLRLKLTLSISESFLELHKTKGRGYKGKGIPAIKNNV